MEKTAVEWLAEKMKISLGDEFKYVFGFFEQAKEMEAKQKGYSEEDMLLFAKFVYEDDGSCTDNDGNVKKDTLEQFKHYKQQEQ
jgi:hypothetical protein